MKRRYEYQFVRLGEGVFSVKRWAKKQGKRTITKIYKNWRNKPEKDISQNYEVVTTLVSLCKNAYE